MSKHAKTEVKPYKLNTTSGTVAITADELRRAFLPLRLARADVLEITVGEKSKRNTSVTSTRATMREVVVAVFLHDGSVKRLTTSRRSAAEIKSAFSLRGWPVSNDL